MRLTSLFLTSIIVSIALVPQYLALRSASLPQPVEAASAGGNFWHARLTTQQTGNSHASSTAYFSVSPKHTHNHQAIAQQVYLLRQWNPQATRTVARQPVSPAPRSQPLLDVIDQPDIQPVHKHIANEVLLAMPENCRDTLQNFYVRYDRPKNRGLAGKTTLILAGHVSNDEFRALMIHELGHVFSLNESRDCLGGSPASGSSEFRDGRDVIYNNSGLAEYGRISWLNSQTQKAGMGETDFCSGYGSWDLFEDFSECFALFVLHNDLFRVRAYTNPVLAAKYQWFERNMFPNGIAIATTREQSDGSVPWDVTKLAYRWHPNNYVARGF